MVPDVFGRHPHAFWLRPAEDTRDALAARALVLDAGGARLAWVALDLVAVDRALTRAVERRLAAAGLRAATLILSASHTHSGPGAFVDSALLAWLAMDRLDAAVRDAIVDAAVTAIRHADAARVPARVGASTVAAPAVTVSRLDRPLDREIRVLRVAAAGGAPIALVWNHAIHGTMLSARNLRLSGDVMGVASRALERALGVPALFVNGAVGDVSPRHHGESAMREVGAALAGAAREGWDRATPGAADGLRVARRRVTLPAPRLSLAGCLRGWSPRGLTLPLGAALPRDAELVAASVGNVAWVTVPGELQTALGAELRRGAARRFAPVLIAGTSNDYLGYFVTPEDYARPGYVTCASVYGPGAGACLVETAGRLLAEVGGPDAWRPPAGGPSACAAAR